MKRRFIISIHMLDTSDTAKKIIEQLKSINPAIGWWHYISGLWLVVDNTDSLSAERLRKELHELFPSAQFMVFEVEPGGTWSGWGPTKAQKWLEEQWISRK